jgi:tol-pal system protein YbgF
MPRRRPSPFLLPLILLVLAAGCASQSRPALHLQARLLALQSRVDELESRLSQEEAARKALARQLRASGQATSPQAPDQAKAPKDTAPKDTARKDTAQAAAQNSTVARAFYQHALQVLLDGQPRRAQHKLKMFLQKYPDHELVPNARYWLGESHYVQQEYAKSILAFKQVSSTFPQHPKAADALLKMGLAYRSLGRESTAQYYLQNVIEKYPESPSASKARGLLESGS